MWFLKFIYMWYSRYGIYIANRYHSGAVRLFLGSSGSAPMPTRGAILSNLHELVMETAYDAHINRIRWICHLVMVSWNMVCVMGWWLRQSKLRSTPAVCHFRRSVPGTVVLPSSSRRLSVSSAYQLQLYYIVVPHLFAKVMFSACLGCMIALFAEWSLWYAYDFYCVSTLNGWRLFCNIEHIWNWTKERRQLPRRLRLEPNAWVIYCSN